MAGVPAQEATDVSAQPPASEAKVPQLRATGVPTLMRSALLERRKGRLALTGLDCRAAAAETREPHRPLMEQLKQLYSLQEELGQGAHSVVYAGARRSDGLAVAIKTTRADDPELLNAAEAEYRVLKDLRHENIVQALDFLSGTNSAALILRQLPRAITLHQAVRAAPGGRLSEDDARPLCRQLLGAVDYLHQHRVVHRDVKAPNVLVTRNLRCLQLCDFNTARRLLDGGALTAYLGDLEYLSPEVARGGSQAEGTDVWCAGLCLFVMLAGAVPRRPQSYPTVERFRGVVASEEVQLLRYPWSEPCKALLGRCLTLECSMRPAPMTLLGCEWLGAGGTQTLVPGGASPACGRRFRSVQAHCGCAAKHGPRGGTAGMQRRRHSLGSRAPAAACA